MKKKHLQWISYTILAAGLSLSNLSAGGNKRNLPAFGEKKTKEEAPESLQESLRYLYRSIAATIDNGNTHEGLTLMASIIHDFQMSTAVNTGNINEAYETEVRDVMAGIEQELARIDEGDTPPFFYRSSRNTRGSSSE